MLPCPRIAQIEVYHTQPKFECLAQFAANRSTSQVFYERVTWTQVTCEQFQLELRSHMQQTSDCNKTAINWPFPAIYKMVNSNIKGHLGNLINCNKATAGMEFCRPCSEQETCTAHGTTFRFQPPLQQGCFMFNSSRPFPT